MSCQQSLDPKTLQLALEHASLTAKHASGDSTVVARIVAIEAELQLEPAKIAEIAVGNYMGDY
ncbi:MAG: hypothetical protein MUF19_00740 [Candidatus Pacebacteria bacterium]|jgi:hypothetical protein|nr:hypothetical protein [Candidatus Paceibacterota bacterium]